MPIDASSPTVFCQFSPISANSDQFLPISANWRQRDANFREFAPIQASSGQLVRREILPKQLISMDVVKLVVNWRVFLSRLPVAATACMPPVMSAHVRSLFGTLLRAAPLHVPHSKLRIILHYSQ
jgi:hypothetical protein